MNSFFKIVYYYNFAHVPRWNKSPPSRLLTDDILIIKHPLIKPQTILVEE